MTHNSQMSPNKKKIVLTILCDGTKFNTQHQSIVGELEHAIDAHSLNKGYQFNPPPAFAGKQQEQHYKIYVPGPGANPNENYARPGKFNPITGQTKDQNKNYKSTGENPELFHEAHGLHLPEVGDSQLAILNALISGQGLRDNVLHVMDCVGQLICDPNVDWENCEVDIQIAGWSRGGITAGIIANMLTASFVGSHASVSVIQIDPVGGSDFCDKAENQDCKGIGQNVVEQLAILAMDDPRERFKALELEAVEKKEVYKALPLHGSHAAVAKGDAPSASITRHLIGECFSKRGVKFQPKATQFTPRSTVQLLELYAQSRQQQRQHAYKMDPIKRLIYGEKQRQFLKNYDVTLLLPQYFVNSQHEKLVQDNCPKLFEYLLNPLIDEAELMAAEKNFPKPLINSMRQKYGLEELEELQALEIIMALLKCGHLLENTQPALTQVVKEHILLTLKEDYLATYLEKTLIKDIDRACDAYINCAKQEVEHLNNQIKLLEKQKSPGIQGQDMTFASLNQARDSYETKIKAMGEMQSILHNESLADKNKLRQFQQQFKAKRTLLTQGVKPKMRGLIEVIMIKLKSALQFLVGLQPDLEPAVPIDSTPKPAFNAVLTNIDVCLDLGVMARMGNKTG